ncbi:DUF1642 domain-containing protein [Lactococcus petauri]|uniref:DUF1642 domain-containing protein n=1 Tax=Lactococcus petauri TaxID=1940789 RepID=UPI0022E8A4D8|nr:DUF1642 domain-containing protein [Lactococcus petauri]
MTKFEEKLEILPIKIIQHPVGDTKYYAAVHVKTLITQADEEIADLKSQLQQQALPVVPECVAEFIESYKDRRTIYGVFDKISKNRKTYPKLYEWVFEDENSQATFALAFITGKYQVEKPQLFYLRDELTGQFLAKDNQFKDKDRYFFWTGADPLTHSIGTAWKLTFTQEEIDSMQTGSYELVPVEDE